MSAINGYKSLILVYANVVKNFNHAFSSDRSFAFHDVYCLSEDFVVNGGDLFSKVFCYVIISLVLCYVISLLNYIKRLYFNLEISNLKSLLQYFCLYREQLQDP